ncbi:CmcJ/NvfI family oxidoreductase [Sphingomonas profundi]|uniref:CmcJ/NvfI family oxidoreductase n=1 Tax=Alterirhizorhabdus profundi TaxID=2681549 RepID=UPI0012E8BC39|nr:CmcJ/NvfI family oxidoreductase [Sphingomonas profundi]
MTITGTHQTADTDAPAGTVRSTMNYLGPMDEAPYVDVADRSRTRLAVDPRTMTFTDARAFAGDLSLDVQGFRLVSHHTALERADFRDPGKVDGTYLREMEQLVQAETGADLVVSAHGPLLRLNAERTDSVRPASIAHTDYSDFTLRTQIGFQLDLTDPALAGYSRIEAYQTWRALSPPPQDNTLAFCDARTVDLADRVLSRFTVQLPRRADLEFYMYRYNPAHRWYYFSDLRLDEILLFKGFEGDGADRMNVLHGGFENVACPAGAEPRESIETRAFAFFR